MDAVMYHGLQCTIETGRGRCLLLRKADEPLRTDQLAQLDIRMLQRNSVPHLLPMDVEEINGHVTLRYRIPAARGLMQVLQTAKGDVKLLLELLHSIVLVLEDSRLYMLDETKYALHPSLIFVGRDVTDPYLVYLPLQMIDSKPSLRQELYRLTVTLFDWAHIPAEICPVLLDCLKSSLFELSEFKRLLIGLQADSGILRASSLIKTGQPMPGLASKLEQERQSRPVGFSAEEEAEVFFAAESVITPLVPREQRAESKKNQPDLLSDDGDTLHFNPKGIPLSAAASFRILLVSLAAVWLVVALKPVETVIWLAAGVSLLLVLLYRTWTKRIERTNSVEDEIFDEGVDSPIPLLNKPLPMPAQALNPLRQDAGPSGDVPRTERTFGWTEEQHKLYADNPARTVMLMESEPATAKNVPLPPTEVLVPETKLLLPDAAIEWKKEGAASETTIITKDRFVYGRNPAENDLVLPAAGISRVHGEIIREGQGWILRDLNSRNGSKLNGEPLVANQTYELKNGDCIAAADTQFIFRVL